MEVIKQYKCEVCNNIYNDMEKAEKCEETCMMSRYNELNYQRSLSSYYRSLGRTQVSKYEAYHITHGGDKDLLEDVLLDIAGFERHKISSISDVEDLDECVLEVDEEYDSHYGLECSYRIYTKEEWLDRLSQFDI